MNTYDNISIVPPDFQFIGGVNDGLTYPLTLNQTSRNYLQGEQNRVLSLEDQYNTERNKSPKFRLSSKFQLVMDNNISGTTNVPTFKNNLYYVNPESSAQGVLPWGGYPQYYEFDFFRNDTDNTHIGYKPISAYSYNWSFAVTYPHKNVDANMSFSVDNGNSINFSASDGIPYQIKKKIINGKPLIVFECPVPHNLTVLNYILLPFSFNNQNVFPVYSLGDGTHLSEVYKFTLYDIGYGSTFEDGDLGTFKKVIDPKNLEETTSTYYCREHKVLVTNDDINVVKSGYELNGFNSEKKLEYASLTPNNVRRISIKNATQAYSFVVKKDITVTGLTDNNGLPVTKVFYTITNKGYSGYFNKPKLQNQNKGGLKMGWEFNITSGGTNNWWNDFNLDAVLPLNVAAYTPNGPVQPNTVQDPIQPVIPQVPNPGQPVPPVPLLPQGPALPPAVGFEPQIPAPNPIIPQNPNIPLAPFQPEPPIQNNDGNFTFYYNPPLSLGQTIIGDFCEFNKITQTEFVVSENYHKINFNQNVFSTSPNTNNTAGYYYKPHYEVNLKTFSIYVENFNGNGAIDNLPNWAYYSKNYNKWIWRDLYDIGFIDQDGNGVNHPFTNDASYVYKNFSFKLIPEGRKNKGFTQVIYQPLSDDCQ